MRNTILTVGLTLFSTTLLAAPAPQVDASRCAAINAQYAALAAGGGCVANAQCQEDVASGLRQELVNAGCSGGPGVAATGAQGASGQAAAAQPALAGVDANKCAAINARYAALAAGGGCVGNAQCQADVANGLSSELANAGCGSVGTQATGSQGVALPAQGAAQGATQGTAQGAVQGAAQGAVAVCSNGVRPDQLAYKPDPCCLPRDQCHGGYGGDAQYYTPGCGCQQCQYTNLCQAW